MGLSHPSPSGWMCGGAGVLPTALTLCPQEAWGPLQMEKLSGYLQKAPLPAVGQILGFLAVPMGSVAVRERDPGCCSRVPSFPGGPPNWPWPPPFQAHVCARGGGAHEVGAQGGGAALPVCPSRVPPFPGSAPPSSALILELLSRAVATRRLAGGAEAEAGGGGGGGGGRGLAHTVGCGLGDQGSTCPTAPL